MKKLIAMLGVMVVLASLTACGAPGRPYDSMHPYEQGTPCGGPVYKGEG